MCIRDRLTPEQAINASITGPILRSTGVPWDLRKNDPYDFYDKVQFDVPVHNAGDNYSRYLLRVQEMRESLKIVKQCVDFIEPGPVRPHHDEVPFLIRPPKGDCYVAIEGSKGELGFYLVSDGSISPYRWHVRSSSLINLTLLREMLIGTLFGDLFVTFGGIDINMGEVDR